jgi:hypothetical protein
MIVAISGLAGSGKDALADFLIASHGFHRLALADPLKHFCQRVFGFSDGQLWGPSARRSECAPGSTVTARLALQTLGTDWGRALDEDIWARMGVRMALEKVSEGKRVVVPDVRFSNELGHLRDAGAYCVRVRRRGSGLTGREAEHASEREQEQIDDASFHQVIDNDGTLQELHRWADRIVIDALG